MRRSIMHGAAALLVCALGAFPAWADEPKNGERVQALVKDLQDKTKDDNTKLAAVIALADFGPQAAPAVPALVELLKTQNEDLRLNAAITLGKVGEKAIAALTGLLTDADEDVRYYAVWSLGMIGKEAASTAPAVIKLLSDKSDSVRRKAAFALGRIEARPQDAVPALVLAFKDANADVCDAAAEAVGRYRKTAVPGLVVGLKANEANVRLYSVRALGKCGLDAEPALNDLRQLFKDKDPGVQAEVAEAMGKIGKIALPVLAQALNDDDPAGRRYAVEAMAKVGADAGNDLVDALKNKHGDVRMLAIRKIAELRITDKSVILSLGEAAHKDADDMVRYHAVVTLMNVGGFSKMATPSLHKALADPSPLVRLNAYHALANLGENPMTALQMHLKSEDAKVRTHSHALAYVMGVAAPDGDKVLDEAVKSKDIDLRVSAAYALAIRGSDKKELTPILIEGLKGKASALRMACATALQQRGAAVEGAGPALVEALKDTVPEVRQAVMQALLTVKSDPKMVAAALGGLLKDPDVSVRQMVVNTLPRFGEEAVPFLLQAMKDRDENVRQYAMWNLQGINVDAKKLLPLLTKMYKDEGPEIRQGIMAMLPRFGAEGLPLMREGLKDKDGDLRLVAVTALMSLGEAAKPAAKELAEAARKDPKAEVRQYAIYAMAAFGDDGLAVLIDLLKDKDATVKQTVLQSLVRFGPKAKGAVPTLIPMLKDEHPQTRWMTCQALAYIGKEAKAAIPALKELLKDKDPNVRGQAEFAINAIEKGMVPVIPKPASS